MTEIHADYVAAVCAVLPSHGLRPSGLNLGARAGIRFARFDLSLTSSQTAHTLASRFTTAWDDQHGWHLTPAYAPETGINATAIYRGGDIVATPDQIAGWLGMALTTPELVANDPDRPTPDQTMITAALTHYRNTTPREA
jgi:hypothetical protein